MSAGLWHKHLFHKAKLAMGSRCDRCGNDRDDTYHRFWECKALKSTCEEDASLFQEFRYGEAPACLTTCGLAMELAGNVTGAFWASDGMREQDQLQRKRRSTTSGSRYIAKCRLRTELLADYHGPDRILDIQLSPKVQSESGPPQQANTFTDASVLLPRIPWVAYAGIGIVHIDSNTEKELTEPVNDETRRQQTMSSSISNSTRMEPRLLLTIRRLSKASEEIRTGGTSQRDGLTSQTGICGRSG